VKAAEAGAEAAAGKEAGAGEEEETVGKTELAEYEAVGVEPVGEEVVAAEDTVEAPEDGPQAPAAEA
jgi:hypothetical protein